jgi:hypothetical protein
MRVLNEAELTSVSGAGEYVPCDPVKQKGNNGWGNGGNDGIPGNSSQDPDGAYFKVEGDSTEGGVGLDKFGRAR